MNYYNPYTMMMPYTTSNMLPAKTGLFSNLISGMRGMNWGTLLTNTQRTLGLINQAIPVVKQVTPVMKNAKTMFRVMNEFKKVDEPTTVSKQQTKTTPNNQTNTPSTPHFSINQPTFFI